MNNAAAITASTAVRLTILRPVRVVLDLPGSISDSRLIPSGVISKAQEKTSATGKQRTITITKTFMTQAGASKVGNKIEAAWISSHATTAYATATL